MPPVTINQIEEQLQRLSPEKLIIVHDFVSYLVEREAGSALEEAQLEAKQTMLASEATLRRDWDTPEEDQAWAHL